MDNHEALALLEQELAMLRREPYEEFAGRISAGSFAYERVGASGASYQIEIQVFRDDVREGHLRVIGSIDDGGWRAFVPLTRDFIKAPDGSFVGE